MIGWKSCRSRRTRGIALQKVKIYHSYGMSVYLRSLELRLLTFSFASTLACLLILNALLLIQVKASVEMASLCYSIATKSADYEEVRYLGLS